MKYIRLSADGPVICLFKVPDSVAENLSNYCLEFENRFDSEPKYENKRRNGYNPVNEFINYLVSEVNTQWLHEIELVNTYIWGLDDEDISEEYRNSPWFNF